MARVIPRLQPFSSNTCMCLWGSRVLSLKASGGFLCLFSPSASLWARQIQSLKILQPAREGPLYPEKSTWRVVLEAPYLVASPRKVMRFLWAESQGKGAFPWEGPASRSRSLLSSLHRVHISLFNTCGSASKLSPNCVRGLEREA